MRACLEGGHAGTGRQAASIRCSMSTVMTSLIMVMVVVMTSLINGCGGDDIDNGCGGDDNDNGGGGDDIDNGGGW